MLVLSRKQGEEIIIGNQLLRIVVVEIRGDKVRLGIEAPPEIPVHRREVFEKITQGSSDPAAAATRRGAPAR